MGATLPVLAQVAAPDPATAGSRVGRLYAANTAGAVLGAASAGFLLLPVLGALATNRLAALVNLAIGTTAILVGRATRRGWVMGPPPPRRPRSARGTVPSPLPSAPERWAVPAALGTIMLAGSLAMVYQVAWNRALGLVLGSSTYAFTVTLTTVLLGLAGGSALAARWVDRLAAPGLALGVVQVLTGVTAFAGLVGLAEAPYLFVRLFTATGGRHAGVVALQFLIAAGLILLPALLAGAVLPLCVRLAATGGLPVAALVGNLYGLNAFGAIVGSVMARFLLVPRTGIRGALVFAILVNLLLAAALGLACPGPRRRLARGLAVVAPLLAVGLVLSAPTWKASVMASGVAVNAPRLARLNRAAFRYFRDETVRLLFYREGITTTVSVELLGEKLSLHVDGKADASTSPVDMPTQVLLGHLPALIHPGPQDVLLIGLGSGITAGAILRHPVRALTVVELEPAVVRASRFFDTVSHRPLEDPRTRLVANDARNHLLLTRDRYDLIVSEPSNPWMAVAATLFTQEFFAQIRDRLTPGGVFGQWLQLYSLAPDIVQTVVATFQAVFPHAAMFRTATGDTILLGSTAPFRIDPDGLRRRASEARVRADLARAGVSGPADLGARIALDLGDATRFAGAAPVNTDDNGRVEFAAPRTLYVDAVAENLRRLEAARTPGGPLARLLQAASSP
jgi:spermidine synthase